MKLEIKNKKCFDHMDINSNVHSNKNYEKVNDVSCCVWE